MPLGLISRGRSALGMCAFFNRSYWPGVVGLCSTRIDLWGCCRSALATSAFINRSYWPGVVGLCSTRLDYRGYVCLFWTHLRVLCFASQRSFLRKTNKIAFWLHVYPTVSSWDPPLPSPPLPLSLPTLYPPLSHLIPYVVKLFAHSEVTMAN